MSEELKPCPFCHKEAQQTLCSGLVSCAYEDCPAFLLAVFPESWNTRAQLPSQGGEAVEVVELLRECRNDFAGVSMSHTLIQRIDAKLASLEVKP